MMFKLEMKTGNAAFKDADGNDDSLCECEEIASVLSGVVGKLKDGYTYGSCIDANGNVVGKWIVE